MPVTYIFSPNTKARSAEVNTNNVDLGTFSGCSLYKSIAEAYMTGAYRDLLFNSELFDTDSYHDTGSNTQRITCATAGYYLFSAIIQFAINNTGIRVVRFNRYNSAAVSQATYTKQSQAATAGGTANNYLNTQAIIYMNAGDFLITEIFQDSGVNVDLAGGVEGCSFCCEFLGI